MLVSLGGAGANAAAIPLPGACVRLRPDLRMLLLLSIDCDALAAASGWTGSERMDMRSRTRRELEEDAVLLRRGLLLGPSASSSSSSASLSYRGCAVSGRLFGVGRSSARFFIRGLGESSLLAERMAAAGAAGLRSGRSRLYAELLAFFVAGVSGEADVEGEAEYRDV